MTKVKSLPTTISNMGSLKTIIGKGAKKVLKTAESSFASTLLEADALVETGSVIFDNAIDGDDWLKTAKEAGAVFVINWGMNFATELAFGSNSHKPKMKPDINEKLTLDNFSYKKTGALSSSYYMLESNTHKYVYTNTNAIDGLNDSIKQNGLYHFTNESACDKILESGYVKKSGYITSYGNKKSFFFNGVPAIGAYATNLDDIPLCTTAVKIMPDSDMLSSNSLKIRNLDDLAITHDGNLSFSSGQASKEYFCLFKENDKLVYKNVSKEFYDNYPNTQEGKLLEDFVSNKSNVTAIKNDFYYNLSTHASGTTEIGASFGTVLNNNVAVTAQIIDNPTFGSSLDVNYEIQLQQKFNQYNKIFDDASDDVKYALIEADKGHAISFRNQADVQTYTKLSDLKKEISNLQEGMEKARKVSSELSTSTKLEADRMYRENLETHNNIPGYDSYYARQEFLRNKSNLDRATEVLDEWGKRHGQSNYAEQALKQYAETGSAYAKINSGELRPYITSEGGVRKYIESLDPEVVSKYLHNKTLSSSSVENLYTFFKSNSSSYIDNFGVNQSGIENMCTYTLNGKTYSYKQATKIVNTAIENGEIKPEFEITATKEWFTLRDKLMSRGFTESQSTVILQNIDDFGACTYAAKSNSIFFKFSNNPQLFEEKFGFPMYVVNDYGQTVLNSNELLLDMYVFANDTYNGGSFFTNYGDSYKFYTDDRIDVFGNKLLNSNNQAFMSDFDGSNEVLVDYLKSKGLEWDSYTMIQNAGNNKLSSEELSGLVDAVEESIKAGKSVQMNVYSRGHGIRLIKNDGTIDIHMKTHIKSDGTPVNWGHAVFVTGVQKNGFIVSSYGRQNLIPFEDLAEGGKFNIMIDNIISVFN